MRRLFARRLKQTMPDKPKHSLARPPWRLPWWGEQVACAWPLWVTALWVLIDPDDVVRDYLRAALPLLVLLVLGVAAFFFNRKVWYSCLRRITKFYLVVGGGMAALSLWLTVFVNPFGVLWVVYRLLRPLV